MSYYFFRDLDHKKNLCDGLSYHAAGYVERSFVKDGKGQISGKDYAVCFFHPFDGSIECEWRSINEVEVFEVSEYVYRSLVIQFDVINGKLL